MMESLQSLIEWLRQQPPEQYLLVVVAVLFFTVYLRLLSRIGPERLTRILRLLVKVPPFEAQPSRRLEGVVNVEHARADSEKQVKKLRAAVLNGIRTEVISDLSGVCSMLEGLYGGSGVEMVSRRTLARRQLQWLLLDALAGEQDGVEPDDSSVIPKIQQLIAEKDQGDPYADLPNRERAVFEDLAAYVNAKDVDNSVRKIGELSSILLTRDDDIARLQATNRTTLWLTVFGFVSSVVFGLLAFLK